MLHCCQLGILIKECCDECDTHVLSLALTLASCVLSEVFLGPAVAPAVCVNGQGDASRLCECTYVSVYSDAGWMLHCVLCVLGCRSSNALRVSLLVDFAAHCCLAV